MEDLSLEQNTPAKEEIGRQTYEYSDASGSLLYRKTRIDYANGTKGFYFERPDGTKSIKGIFASPL